MSSDRKINSSRANGAKSHGPTSPEGKKRSSLNALQHGLLAKCLLLPGEDSGNFEILMQNHERRFQPADGIELGLIEEMCAAYWRLHRVWTMETHTIMHQISTQPAGQPVERMRGAFQNLAAQPGTALMQRYETRLQNMYSRAIRTFKLLRTIPVPDLDDDFPEQENAPDIEFPKEPSPTNEHPSATPVEAVQPSPQPIDPESLGSACFALNGSAVVPSVIIVDIPVAPPPDTKESGAAV